MARSSSDSLASRGRSSIFVLISTASAVFGLVVGVAVVANRSNLAPVYAGDTAGTSGLEQRLPDIVHNPPLLYERGDRVVLDFDLVCPENSCGSVSAALTVTENGRDPEVLNATGTDHFEFVVPASAAASSGFAYRSEFTFEDGRRVDYPTADGTMSAISISQATEVDLGTARFSTAGEDTDEGELVVTGTWGDGPGQFGLNAQLSGPSSFDVDPTTGAVVILDQVNSRLVRVGADGKSITTPISLRAGVPDLAVAPDGTLDVLYANAVSGASLEQFGVQGGEATREIPLATPSANSIRRIGDTVLVEADDSYWVPVSRGTSILSPEAQVAASAPGLTEDGHLVVRKHLRELGNEVRVADSGPAGLRAWRITGDTALGPVLVAAPLPDERVAVVQSQFDNTHSQYSVLVLSDGPTRTLEVPQSLYAGLYDPSEFRLVGDVLYQVRSTEAGYSIYRYQL
jgi:hypothetical protein